MNILLVPCSNFAKEPKLTRKTQKKKKMETPELTWQTLIPYINGELGFLKERAAQKTKE
jgi:hypothetical protein